MIQVFKDTESFINENEILNKAVKNTKARTVVYNQPFLENIHAPSTYNFNNISISRNKTFQAAIYNNVRYPDKKIAVLNFASATTPGGGVVKGSSAQEECLCRASTLYDCLNTKKNWNKFYTPNRDAQNPLHDDKIIYTPDIIICKTDDGEYSRLPENEFVKVDVITCAAPNLRDRPTNSFNQSEGKAVNITGQELYQIHFNRARGIILSAYRNKADILILGAFGCGAFQNNPVIVAQAYRDVLKDLGHLFTEIEFAIFCPYDYETGNYDAFVDAFPIK